MLISNNGSPSSPVWVIVDTPLPGDDTKGYLFSSGIGYVFDKMMQEAGITNYYVTAYRPDIDHRDSFSNTIGALSQYKPPIIIPLGYIGKILLPELHPRRKTSDNLDRESEISKFCGSLLRSPYLGYDHYIIPTEHPTDIIKNWKIRDIVVSCDLQKAASELEYWKKNGHTLQPLPQRNHKITFSCFDELLADIDSFMAYPIISNDIETIYPKAPTKTQASQFYKILPGYPLVVGLAPSKDFGISFDLFRESKSETVELWRRLYKLFYEVPSLGQNFFNFDANYYECLGFRFQLDKCRDTLINHHILWAELPHKLQFQTRQYTREPYYKDEGHGWSPKQMDKLKTYNVKDVCVTMEIYEAQLLELKERGLE